MSENNLPIKLVLPKTNRYCSECWGWAIKIFWRSNSAVKKRNN